MMVTIDAAGTKTVPSRRQRVLGWIALGISIINAGFWSFWGIIENFHEGWWMPTLGGRLLGLLAYMGAALISTAMSCAAIRWSRVGAVVFFTLGAFFTVFIFGNRWPNITLGMVLSWLPTTILVVAVGFVWWFGRPWPKKLAYLLALGIPLLVTIACGIGPAWRVAQRIDDGNRSARTVVGNGVTLVWAPAGPGWVTDGQHACSWDEARELAAHLSADGSTVLAEEQHIWRLPTVDEAVRSMVRHGEHAGGSWDPVTERASYEVTPDKESPLWVNFSEITYWWTDTEVSDGRAYIIVYHGGVFDKRKQRSIGSQGFRAVKDPQPD